MTAALSIDPTTRHDALVLDVATRLQSIGKTIEKVTELHLADRFAVMNALLRQLAIEVQRYEFAVEESWEAKR